MAMLIKFSKLQLSKQNQTTKEINFSQAIPMGQTSEIQRSEAATG
jgi:hypothetical protein